MANTSTTPAPISTIICRYRLYGHYRGACLSWISNRQRERNHQKKCALIAQSQELAHSVGQQLRRLDRGRQLIQDKVDDLINADQLLREARATLLSIKGLGKLTSK